MAYIKSWHPPKAERITVRYTYNVPYALDVWLGFTRADNTRAPGRPWTDAAIAATDFEKVFAKRFKESRNMRKAFMASAEDFGVTLQDMIHSPIWKWDRVTLRQNQTVVSSPRNIFDSGRLAESQEMREV